MNDYIPYSLRIIEQGLKDMDIPVRIYDFDKKRLRSLFKEDKLRIIGISSFLALYEETKTLVKRLTDIPNTFIVVGGPITQDQDYNGRFFGDMPIDALCIGHCQAFLTFVEDVFNLHITTKTNLLELATRARLATRKALHVPVSKFPRLKQFPLQMQVLDADKKLCKIVIPAMSGCSQHCDFCSGVSIVPDQMLLILPEVKALIAQGWNITKIDFDHPTLNQAAFVQAKKLCSYIYELQHTRPSTELVLDSDHFSSANYEKTIAMLDELNAHNLQIGVNAVDESMARQIGRNAIGVPRTQTQLDDEMNGVIRFLTSPASWLASDKKLQGQIDLIVSPFETYDSLKRLFTFCNRVQCAIYRGNKEIQIGIGPLVLFPGTKLYDRHRHLLEESKIRSPRMSVWYDIRIWKKSSPEIAFGLRFLKSFVHNLKFAVRATIDIDYPILRRNELVIQAINLSVAELRLTDLFEGKKTKKIMSQYLSFYTGMVGELWLNNNKATS